MEGNDAINLTEISLTKDKRESRIQFHNKMKVEDLVLELDLLVNRGHIDKTDSIMLNITDREFVFVKEKKPLKLKDYEGKTIARIERTEFAFDIYFHDMPTLEMTESSTGVFRGVDIIADGEEVE